MGAKIDSWAAIGLVALAVAVVIIFDWHATWILPLAIAGVLLIVLVCQAVLYFARLPGSARRLRILETDYGRNAGWVVEWEGREIAVLTEPEFVDMFWESYRIESHVEDKDERCRILTDKDWWLANLSGLTFRNREFNDVALSAFPAGDVFTVKGRIIMRALYLNVDEPNLWDRFILFLRRRS
jgi:hypothetical protein